MEKIKDIKLDIEAKIDYYKKQNRNNYERLHSKIDDFQASEVNNTQYFDAIDSLVGHCRDNCAKIKELENLLVNFNYFLFY